MDLSTLTEYIKIHRISLIQDNANLIQDTIALSGTFCRDRL
jgi:hypothetical protein